MSIDFLIALSIAAGMFLMSMLFREEIASVLCGAIAAVSLIVALVLAPWQIQLLLVASLLSIYNYRGFGDRLSS